MRKPLVLLWMLFFSIGPAAAQVSVGVGVALPGVSIGINLPAYPTLVRVPGYPVYYAPRVNSNYFFYDGMYWVYERDNWYASTWYNGPWGLVAPEVVPLYVLRVPVRYYRQPPAYFGGWRSDAPPRWGEYWGSSWAQSRSGWDNWNRRAVPAPAPLPTYQRQYSGNRYPHFEQQQTIQSRSYRYEPRDAAVRQQYQAWQPQQGMAPQQARPQQQQARPQQQQARPPQQRAAPAQQQAQPPQQRAYPQQQAQPPQQRAYPQQQARPPQQGAAQREETTRKGQEKGEQQGGELRHK